MVLLWYTVRSFFASGSARFRGTRGLSLCIQYQKPQNR